MTVALSFLYNFLDKLNVKPGESVTIELSPEETALLREALADYQDTIFRESIEKEVRS